MNRKSVNGVSETGNHKTGHHGNYKATTERYIAAAADGGWSIAAAAGTMNNLDDKAQ